MSLRIIIYAVLKFLVLCDAQSLAKHDCRTPRKTLGVCKPIKDCPVLANVFMTNKLDAETITHLRQFKCDTSIKNMPTACCENDAYPCKTREKTAGFCVSLYTCPSLANLLDKKPFLSKEVVQQLQSAECSGPDRKARVCCPFIEKVPITHEPLEEEPILPEPVSPEPVSPKPVSTEPTLVESVLPKPGDCGIQEADLRIIGGVKAGLTEFPWMTILEYGTKENPKLSCGGSLINSRFVLTAAHCVDGPLPARYGGVQRVRLGEYNIYNETDCIWYFSTSECNLPILRIDVESIAVHENFVFKSITKEHDIAIIKMKENVETTDYVRPICLPSSELKVPGEFTVAGWGTTEISNESADKLKVNIPFYGKTNCINVYEKLLRGSKLGSGQMCAGGIIGKDSCSGDSGGPLMAGINQDSNQIWYQFGITSFGPTPCGKPQPAIYTIVTEYIPWIKEKISK